MDGILCIKKANQLYKKNPMTKILYMKEQNEHLFVKKMGGISIPSFTIFHIIYA